MTLAHPPGQFSHSLSPLASFGLLLRDLTLASAVAILLLELLLATLALLFEPLDNINCTTHVASGGLVHSVAFASLARLDVTGKVRSTWERLGVCKARTSSE